jgi:polyphosphate kinase 2 (PPK2 family)
MITDAFWEKEDGANQNLRKHITENGTIMLKFFLNISKEEQRERLLRRLEEKNTIGSSQWGLRKRERWMITCVNMKKQ